MSSLISRDSMLLIAGFPETSYPWLRFHMLRFCSTFTLFNVLDLVFTFCALQPNKVYIGGLPENTRQEDLQSCFGKIGNIVNIELKYVSPNPLKVIPDPIHSLQSGVWFRGRCL